MKCIILAAGYATRLYPLTKNFPKSLLKVQNKTILEWLIEDIDSLKAVDEYVVVSNHKFASLFQQWSLKLLQKVTVIDDGTSTNETRLGAVKDIQFAIDSLHLDDDVLVIAGDNLLDFSLKEFIKYSQRKKTSCVMRYFEKKEEKLQKSGVLEIDKTDKIASMEEKPVKPKSHWACPPFYIYNKKDIRLVKQAIEAGIETDAPGSFVAWLCRKTIVHAMEMPGNRYDIGNLESYEKVCREYKGIC